MTESEPSRRRLRMFIAVRARFAEDALTSAGERGVRQLVVLGAGLDTYAYRSSFGKRVLIFEVDHPAMQAWKRERLAEAEIAVLPPTITFTLVDLERETLADGLGAVGFDAAEPTFFTWLGVGPYLTEEAVFATLGFIANLSGGAPVVFDYRNPSMTYSDQEEQMRLARRLPYESHPWASLSKAHLKRMSFTPN